VRNAAPIVDSCTTSPNAHHNLPTQVARNSDVPNDHNLQAFGEALSSLLMFLKSIRMLTKRAGLKIEQQRWLPHQRIAFQCQMPYLDQKRWRDMEGGREVRKEEKPDSQKIVLLQTVTQGWTCLLPYLPIAPGTYSFLSQYLLQITLLI
jgi:hypothetical protein